MIVLDSNQLRFALPGSPTHQLLVAIAERAGHTLATTDIVVAEVVRQHRDELATVLRHLAKAREAANRLMGAKSYIPVEQVLGQLPSNTGSSTAIARRDTVRFEEELRKAYRILPTTPEDALEALLMEAGRQLPCRDGSGARDLAIWRTAARACRTPDVDNAGKDLPVLFVSQDKDFTIPGKASELAEELRSADTEAGRLVLVPTVVGVMAELGYPRKWVPAAEVASLPDVETAVMTAATGGGCMRDFHRSQLETGETRIRFISEGRALQCVGDGLKLTSFSGCWAVRVVTEEFPRLPDGRGGGYRGFPMSVEGKGLVIENETDGTTEVEFAPSRINVPGMT
ncbi:PIN domain-containing protein [Streptomyces cyaneofuscatus]|uniref:PIN domain-containing protein n=1 Tax=Streptomyces cyaneofuscatus TaxID=66883 RepID=UPI00380AD5AF